MDRLGQTGDIASKQFLICDLLAGRLNLYLLHHAGIDDQIPVIDVVLADVWRLNAAEAEGRLIFCSLQTREFATTRTLQTGRLHRCFGRYDEIWSRGARPIAS
jgi:hypothetical protein